MRERPDGAYNRAQQRHGKGAIVYVTDEELTAVLGHEAPAGAVRYHVKPWGKRTVIVRFKVDEAA